MLNEKFLKKTQLTSVLSFKFSLNFFMPLFAGHNKIKIVLKSSFLKKFKLISEICRLINFLTEISLTKNKISYSHKSSRG